MNITLPLKQMTTEEKLQIMEAIWDDLCQHADKLPSPEWHRELLVEREEAIARGDEQFEEWEVARKKIEKDIR
ncbi:addiction module protein [methane-oxidizing endosymbiont of Gigantopelta aegis]|uniref:addiction module protein n=1 Tax=methane-oxidizing endosymbiont of Gigantopelta aegis TaxID=2794938 RepID=UPI0018DD346B|nr:addiction module protein [methane-oxidizing endosymbiont of Gigantopelta aegis]